MSSEFLVLPVSPFCVWFATWDFHPRFFEILSLSMDHTKELRVVFSCITERAVRKIFWENFSGEMKSLGKQKVDKNSALSRLVDWFHALIISFASAFVEICQSALVLETFVKHSIMEKTEERPRKGCCLDIFRILGVSSLLGGFVESGTSSVGRVLTSPFKATKEVVDPITKAPSTVTTTLDITLEAPKVDVTFEDLHGSPVASSSKLISWKAKHFDNKAKLFPYQSNFCFVFKVALWECTAKWKRNSS